MDDAMFLQKVSSVAVFCLICDRFSSVYCQLYHHFTYIVALLLLLLNPIDLLSAL